MPLDQTSFFGLHALGLNNPIKLMVKEEYKEPEEYVNLHELIEMKTFGKCLIESLNELYPGSGFIDGFAYKSNEKLQKLRIKGMHKVYGPQDMFRYPCTRSMDIGWWMEDPNFDSSWLTVRKCPKNYCEMAKYFNTARKTEKFFRL